MSNKDRAIQLLEDIPESKLFFVIDMLESLKGYAGEAIQPDEWDLKMIEQAKQENDGGTKTFDEVCNLLGVEV